MPDRTASPALGYPGPTMARKKHRGPISGLALHHEFYTTLRGKIEDGTYPNDSPLPSEPKLAAQFAVSRTTVRRALARLAAEARIERRHGSGTYVRAKLAKVTIVAGEVAEKTLGTLSKQVPSKILEYTIRNTPPGLRRQFPEFNERCLYIRRIRTLEGEPIMHVAMFVREDMSRLLSRTKLRSDPTIIVYGEAGLRPHFSGQDVTAQAADLQLAGALAVPPGTPVLVVRRCIREANGPLLEFQEVAYRADRVALRTSVWQEFAGETASTRYGGL